MRTKHPRVGSNRLMTRGFSGRSGGGGEPNNVIRLDHSRRSTAPKTAPKSEAQAAVQTGVHIPAEALKALDHRPLKRAAAQRLFRRPPRRARGAERFGYRLWQVAAHMALSDRLFGSLQQQACYVWERLRAPAPVKAQTERIRRRLREKENTG